MNISIEKKRIIEVLNKTDEEWVIKSILRLLNIQESEQQIVGYSAKGAPITKGQLKKRARAATERVKQGNYISQEDMEKSI